MKNPKISVIVCAMDEEKYIGTALASLRNQRFKDFEIIVVDGNSKDRTREIARKYAKVIVEKKPKISAARNAGARIAKGDILFFTDADIYAGDSLLGTYYNMFKDKNIAGATGPLTPLEETTGFIKFGFVVFTVVIPKLTFKLGSPGMIGSNFAVRKSAFIKSGGFDESLATYEDLDLSSRLAKQGSLAYVDEAKVSVSTRRIKKWGIFKFGEFHIENILLYNFFKRPKYHYERIR